MKPSINTQIYYSKLQNIEVDGIDFKDYPDFCDAFISYAEIDGRPLTDEELDQLSDDSEFVYAQVERHLY